MLNQAQRQAVEHGDGPLLVLAGAGSGKTRVLTHRIAHLVESGRADPSQILAMTFTAKAAEEMRERLSRLIGPRARAVTCGTFHAVCLAWLREIGRTEDVLDAQQSGYLLRRAINEARLSCGLAAAQQYIETVANECGESDPTHPLNAALEAYRAAKRAKKAMDFGDLLTEWLAALRDQDRRQTWQERYRYVLIDEYQDTNRTQAAIAEIVSEPERNLTVVGDDDQAIYTWRGARPEMILGHLGPAVILERNYRSTPEIVHASNALIAHNTIRRPKRLTSTSEAGSCVRILRHHDAAREAAVIVEMVGAGPLEDWAVLYRTNAQSARLELALMAAEIPYRIAGGGGGFWALRIVRDLVAWLRLVEDPDDGESLRRILNRPNRFAQRAGLDQVEALAAERGVPLMSVMLDQSLPNRWRRAVWELVEIIETFARRASMGPAEDLELLERRLGYLAWMTEEYGDGEDEVGTDILAALLDIARQFGSRRAFLDHVRRAEARPPKTNGGPRVTLSTIHRAKGLEWPRVIVAGCSGGTLPHASHLEAEDPSTALEEERRLAYVAMTRARQDLILSWWEWRMDRGREVWAGPSPFLAEAGLDEGERSLEAWEKIV